MTSILDYATENRRQLLFDSYQHFSAVVQAVVAAALVSVLLGIAVYRTRWAAEVSLTVSSALLTIPAFALLGILIPVFHLGLIPSLITLVIYSLLPILRNTIVGLRAVDATVVDAARGIGLSRAQTLLRVELPQAWPSILTGIRVSAQMAMGVLAIAAYAKGPGLGNLIFTGLARVGSPTAVPMVVTATVLIVVLALVLDGLLVGLGRFTTPKGIRV